MATLMEHKRNGTTSNKNKRLPSTLKQGDIVLLTQARVGVVRYIGAVDGKSQSANDHFIGIEIRITDGAVGDNNGTYNHKTYFNCNKDCGLFIEPQQIIQVYSPEDLLEMIISLKDKLLPLMTMANNNTNKMRNKPRSLSNGSAKSPTNSWPSNNAPTMSYIKEEEDIEQHNKNNSSSVHWNVQVDTPGKTQKKPSKIQHGIYWSGSNTNLKDFHHKLHANKRSNNSTFDDVDMNISAPRGLMNFFENDGVLTGVNGNISPISVHSGGLLSPTGNKNDKHFNMRSRVSFLKANRNTSSLGGTMIASYQKLKLMHRCVTLRRKVNMSDKKSLVLDLANFGFFLKNEQITEKHKWYEIIWNKYDKLFKFKIEFYFVNELLSDLLNEYLISEYEVNISNIMTVDIKKAIQQIIIHIRPYHIEQHQNDMSPFPESGDLILENNRSSVSDEDEMPFTFNDFCNLGHWLFEIEEMEEDDELIEDYFMMDIHYWDFVQYIQSHKFHIWKKVIHKLINKGKNNKHIIHKFNKNKISNVLKECLCDYGKNGLGNVNMEIYAQQIKEYTHHLCKLFIEWNNGQLAQISRNERKNHKNVNKKHNYMTKKEFFEFIACIPSL